MRAATFPQYRKNCMHGAPDPLRNKVVSEPLWGRKRSSSFAPVVSVVPVHRVAPVSPVESKHGGPHEGG